MNRYLLFSLISLGIFVHPGEARADTQGRIGVADQGPRCEATVTPACLVVELEALLSWNTLSADMEALHLALAETQLAAGQIAPAFLMQQKLTKPRSQAKFLINYALHLIMVRDEQLALKQLHEARAMMGEDLLQEPDGLGLDLAVLFARAGAKAEAQLLFKHIVNHNLGQLTERPRLRKLMAVSASQATVDMPGEAAESMDAIYGAAQSQALPSSALDGFFKQWAAISPEKAIDAAEILGQSIARAGQDVALCNLWLELARGLPENHAGRQAMLDRVQTAMQALPDRQDMRGLSLNLAHALLRAGDKQQALVKLEAGYEAIRQMPSLSEKAFGLLPFASAFASAGKPELERRILLDLREELAKADDNSDPVVGLVKVVFPSRLASGGLVEEAYEIIQNSDELVQGAMLKSTAEILVAQGKYGDALRFIRAAEPLESAQAMAILAFTIEKMRLKNVEP